MSEFVATINVTPRLNANRGAFHARACSIEHEWVHVRGRWMRELDPSTERTYSWPVREVRQVRWTREGVTA